MSNIVEGATQGCARERPRASASAIVPNGARIGDVVIYEVHHERRRHWALARNAEQPLLKRRSVYSQGIHAVQIKG